MLQVVGEEIQCTGRNSSDTAKVKPDCIVDRILELLHPAFGTFLFLVFFNISVY